MNSVAMDVADACPTLRMINFLDTRD
ncbi:hypothetical protein NC652_037604 [Populus alba x Populus x berolinensis]|nr:hypothetical protein NC652_037604 [Populus alba x Populus x berolinensis]